MSKNGGIGLVIALIVFVVLLFIVIGQQGKEAKEGVKELKVEKIDKDAVTKIDVTMPAPTPGDAADAGPASNAPARKVVLEKDGESWKVYDGVAADKKYAADDAQMKMVLDAVDDFATGDLISNKKDKLADFDIDDAQGTVVVVSTKEGKALDLVFGRPAKGGGSTVRKAGSSDVYVAKGRLGSIIKKDVSGWRKKAIVDVKLDDITRVATTSADGQKVVVEAKTPPAPPAPDTPDAGPPPPPPRPEWSLVEPSSLPAGFRLDKSQLSRVASAVATLRAQDFADGVSDADAGLAGAHTKVELTTKDGKSVVINVGKEDDKKRVYVKLDGDPQVYLVASYSAKQLNRTLDDMREMTLVDADIANIEKVTFKGSQGTLVVKKDGTAWKLVEPKKAPDGFDASQIGMQVGSLLRTRATHLADDAPKTAMARPSPVVEIDLKGGKKQVLRFGEPVALGDDAKKDAKPREYYAKGGVDDLTYVVAAFTRNRLDKPDDLFKKPPTPPAGMMGGGGMIPGMDKLPPDVRKKLMESIRKGNFPPKGN